MRSTVYGRAGELEYSWHPKTEPLVWIADAIGGVVREHLLGHDPHWFEAIAGATGLSIEFLSLP